MSDLSLSNNLDGTDEAEVFSEMSPPGELDLDQTMDEDDGVLLTNLSEIDMDVPVPDSPVCEDEDDETSLPNPLVSHVPSVRFKTPQDPTNTQPIEGQSSLITPPATNPPTSIQILSEIFRHVLKHLDFQDVLRCRLVSRDVSEAVDRQLESSLEISSSNSSSNTPQPSPFVQCRIHSSAVGPLIHEGIHLFDTPALKHFLSQMETTSPQRNPFIGRFVRFGNYGDTTHNSDYWDSALELMRRFGHHIWHVELSDGHVSIPDPIVCYKLIRQCLGLLPNLKSLEISFSHDDVDENKLEALVEYMNGSPMPLLKYLEKLEWTDCQVSPVMLDSVVGGYSKNLKALAGPFSVLYVEISNLTFRNLGALYLTNIRDNESLIELRWCKLPSLKTLYLNLGGERTTSCGDLTGEVWSVKPVLQLVKQFQLEFLSVFIAPGGQLKGSRTLNTQQWRLESLKTLEIHHMQDMSYEFLKCFPNIHHIHFFDIHHPLFPERTENLSNGRSVVDVIDGSQTQSEVIVEEPTSIKDTVEIEQYLYTRKMYESNVWKVIPSLNLVTFKCVWDRKGKTLIAVNDWYWRESFERRNKSSSYMGQVVSKVFGFVRSMFSFS